MRATASGAAGRTPYPKLRAIQAKNRPHRQRRPFPATVTLRLCLTHCRQSSGRWYTIPPTQWSMISPPLTPLAGSAPVPLPTPVLGPPPLSRVERRQPRSGAGLVFQPVSGSLQLARGPLVISVGDTVPSSSIRSPIYGPACSLKIRTASSLCSG